MNQTTVAEGSWPPLRWAVFSGIVFVLQLALIWLLGDRRLSIPATGEFGASVRLQPEWHASAAAAEGQDPASLALPSGHGFSGEAWLEYKPPTHRLAEWDETPAWLSLGTHVRVVGARISDLAGKSQPPLLRVADEPLPWTPAVESPVPPVSFPEHSRLEFAGGVVLDPAVQSPTLPSWQSNDVVSNSIVRVAFDRAGRPFSCVLLGKSGLKDADDYALRLATALRYRASALPDISETSENLHFGKLIFQWHTVPPPIMPRGVTSLPLNP
jgi:hypothetical protein